MWFRILWRALRWRRSSGLALLGVAVVAFAASAVGPIFLRAADDSSLSNTLDQSPVGSTDVSFESAGSAGLSTITGADHAISGLQHSRWFSRPVLSVDAGVAVGPARGQLYSADLLSRGEVCRHVRLLAGSCPTGLGDVAVSARSARETGIAVGQRVPVTRPGRSRTLSLTVVGIYEPPVTVDNSYWNGNNYFAFGAVGTDRLPSLDPLVASQGTVLSSVRLGLQPQISSQVQLRPGTLRSSDVGSFDSALRHALTQISQRDSLTGSTTLFSVLGQTTHDEGVMATVVEAVVIQLLLLTLLVLYSMVSLSGRDREGEVEIARRRGFPRLALLVVAVGEPIALLVVALPLGLLLAWVVVDVAAPALFLTGTPTVPTVNAVLSAGAGFLGGVAAVIVASWGLVGGTQRTSADRWQRRSVATAVDAGAVALAAAGLIALTTQGSLGGTQADPVALLAPGLLAVGAGVIALRLVTLVIRASIGPSRDSHRLARFLAVREVARRWPSPLRQLFPLIVAVVLAVFALCSWSVASSNRSALAGFQVGAARVVNVRVRPGVNLVAAVRRADPAGRSAMAAAVLRSQDGDTLAVDASRLAAVASWPPSLADRSVSAVARYLDPPAMAPVTFVGTSLRARIILAAAASPIALTATVFNETSQDQDTVELAAAGPGTGTYVGELEGFCNSTCRIVDLTPTAPSLGADAPRAIGMTLTSLAVDAVGRGWRTIAFGNGVRGSWTAAPAAVGVTSGPGLRGVRFSLPSQDLDTQAIVLSPADVPTAIPAVVTDSLAAVDSPTPPDDGQAINGLDGGTLNAAGEIQVRALPEIGGDAALVNLPFAQLAETGPDRSTPQVWLSPGASASILLRLRSLGVTAESGVSASTRAAMLNKGPLALAYVFVLWSAPVAALLAVGSALFVIAATRRQRRRTVQALAVVGVGRPAIIKSIVLESVLVLGAALVIGVGVGVLATSLALSSIPQFPQASVEIPISHALPVGWLITAAVTFAAIFAVIVATTPALIVGRLAYSPTAEADR